MGGLGGSLQSISSSVSKSRVSRVALQPRYLQCPDRSREGLWGSRGGGRQARARGERVGGRGSLPGSPYLEGTPLKIALETSPDLSLPPLPGSWLAF